MLRKRNARGLIAFEDISLPEFDAAQYGLTMEQVVGAMHAIRPDGAIVRGVDVFAEVYDAVGWTWLARFIRWRVTRPLAKFGYRIFATVRPWLSGFKPTECTDACKRPVGGRVASVALLIFLAASISGCSTSTSQGAAPSGAIGQQTSHAAEDSKMKKPFMIGEARLPEGFPPPGPVGQVIVKNYPRSRAATVRADAAKGGENGMFRSLFKHIKTNNIAMSTPVDMTLSDPGEADGAPRETAMAFIYGDPTLGKPGPDGIVQVVDLPAQTVLSIGVRGSYSQANFVEGFKKLKSFLAQHDAEYRVVGPPRFLAYNSPFVPWFMKLGEVQLPVVAIR